MLKRLPVIPTLLVLAAVAVMVRLGFWQLDRLHQKEAAIASFSAAMGNSAVISPDPWAISQDGLGYRRASLDCSRTDQSQLVAGANQQGEVGWAYAVPCKIRDFEGFKQLAVIIGWSKDMHKAEWGGGRVEGVLVPGAKSGVVLIEVRGQTSGVVSNAPYHLVADPPLTGLQPNAKPDPNNIPNNHLSYAVQWFLFALTALVIYGLALRKRLREA